VAKRIAASFGLLAVLIAVPAADAQLPSPRADPRLERRTSLDDVLLETVRVETQLQAWTLRKLCLDGQAYWVGFGDSTPTGISLAYKDGKPEQCKARAR
jgi:hypothetical protein